LDGSEGNDPLFGGADNNTVSGAKDDDILPGASGKDNPFIFGPTFGGWGWSHKTVSSKKLGSVSS